MAVVSGVLALQALSLILPPLADYPEGWVIQLAPTLNNVMQWFTVAAFSVTSAIKTWMVFVVLTACTGEISNMPFDGGASGLDAGPQCDRPQ